MQHLTEKQAQDLARVAIGRVHTHTQQPYGTQRFTIERASVRQYPGGYAVDIAGEVIEGSETSYLCGYRSTRDMSGQWAYLYAYKTEDLMSGESSRVSCG